METQTNKELLNNMIPGISPDLFSHVFIPPAAGETPSTEQNKLITSHDLLILSVAMYFHQVVIKSWAMFSESTEETAEKNTQDQRAREVRHGQVEAMRLEGQRRQIEVLRDTPTDDIQFPDAVKRQAGKFRFVEGMYTGDSDRHLNLPV